MAGGLIPLHTAIPAARWFLFLWADRDAAVVYMPASSTTLTVNSLSTHCPTAVDVWASAAAR